MKIWHHTLQTVIGLIIALFAMMATFTGCGSDKHKATPMTVTTTPTPKLITPTFAPDFSDIFGWNEVNSVVIKRGDAVKFLVSRTGTAVQEAQGAYQSQQTIYGKNNIFVESEIEHGFGDSGAPAFIVKQDAQGHKTVRFLGGLWTGGNTPTKVVLESSTDIMDTLKKWENGDLAIDNSRSFDSDATCPWKLNVSAGTFALLQKINPRFAKFQLAPARSQTRETQAGSEVLAPGQTISVVFLRDSNGNALISSDGTITIARTGADGSKILYLFCHELDNTGARNLPLTASWVDWFDASDTWGGAKWSHSVGPIIGSLKWDGKTGCIAKLGDIPTTSPVDVSIIQPGGGIVIGSYQMARDNGSWMEQISLETALSDPFDRVKPATGTWGAKCTLTLKFADEDQLDPIDISVPCTDPDASEYDQQPAKTMDALNNKIMSTIYTKLTELRKTRPNKSIEKAGLAVSIVVSPMPPPSDGNKG